MLKNLTIAALTAPAYAAEEKKAEVCRAVAMSGGGTLGAYEAGALYGLYHGSANPGANFDYDVITGVSAGSINTLGLSVFKKDDTANAVQEMSDIWASLQQDDLYVQWMQPAVVGMVHGVLNESGIFDTSPFYKKTKQVFEDLGGKIFRKVVVSAVDTNSGTFTDFNETYPDYPQAVVASSSIPVIFPTAQFDDTWYTDGGVVFGVNIHSAINRCLEVVDDPKDIIVDIIMCSTGGNLPEWEQSKTTVDHYNRNGQVQSFHTSVNDIYSQRKAYPQVQWRYLIEPTAPLAGNILNPENSTTWPFQMQGRLDGAAAVQAGEGAWFLKFDDYDNLSPELKRQYRTPSNYIKSLNHQKERTLDEVKPTISASIKKVFKKMMNDKEGLNEFLEAMN